MNHQAVAEGNVRQNTAIGSKTPAGFYQLLCGDGMKRECSLLPSLPALEVMECEV